MKFGIDPSRMYWNHTGKYESLAAKLKEMVPFSGPVKEPTKNKALDKFRRASNCYYDLYNNGLCNRKAEFRRVFKIKGPLPAYDGYCTTAFMETVEEAMDNIVLMAAAEQKIISEAA